MQRKSTISNSTIQPLPAGIAPNDHNIEFIGCKQTLTTFWMQYGNIHAFENLHQDIYNKYEALYLKDLPARRIITMNHPDSVYNMRRQVELFILFNWGDLDTTPDIIDGEIQPSENFRLKEDCISLGFDTKNIDINGVPLSKRFIKMIDAWKLGKLDSVIAEELGIGITTYDFHKSKLFKILGASSKPEAVAIAFKYHVLCA